MYGIKTVVQMQHTVQNFLWAFIWDEKCVILLILWMGTAVNSYCCVEIQRNLKAYVCRVHLTKCLQYYSSMIMQGHTKVCTTEAIVSFGWTVMPHPPYSSDLITSAYHLFVTSIKGLWGHHYALTRHSMVRCSPVWQILTFQYFCVCD